MPALRQAGRYCGRCNRPLAHHERGEAVSVTGPVTGRARKWRPPVCDIRLVGTNPHTGKTMIPAPTVTTQAGAPFVQRIAENDARYVHADVLRARGMEQA